ncbi:hypothetical protein ABK040_015717 [Willaertia magna]
MSSSTTPQFYSQHFNKKQTTTTTKSNSTSTSNNHTTTTTNKNNYTSHHTTKNVSNNNKKPITTTVNNNNGTTTTISTAVKKNISTTTTSSHHHQPNTSTNTTTFSSQHHHHSHSHHQQHHHSIHLENKATYPIIDIGANLTNHKFKTNVPSLLKRSAQANVMGIIVTGTSIGNSLLANQIVNKFNNNDKAIEGKVALRSTFGIHPHDAKEFKGAETISFMRKTILENKKNIVMVGECGLDYNRMYSNKDIQKICFKEQLKLACELNLPVFCHERDAHEDFVAIVKEVIEEGNKLPNLVVHCFTGNEKELENYISLGFYIGLTGFIGKKKRGEDMRRIIGKIPLDKLMIETDAPFMAPFDIMKKQEKEFFKEAMEPCLLPYIVDVIVDCHNEIKSKEDLEKQLTENTHKFLGSKLF